MNRSTLRRSTLPAVLLTIALAATACGGSNDPSGTTSMPSHDMNSMSTPMPSSSTTGTPAVGQHNDADVTFATGMIPHHAQAVFMADMAKSNATSAQVKELAATIKAAQTPEITTMSGWLAGWGKPDPTSSSHSGMSMGDGMMTDTEMNQLGNATGSSFERMWLQMMIEHHEGAIAMATIELKTGANAEAKQLARSIMTSQKAEITRIQKLESSLS
jgi:uncharacterized protein (DUF305 family)